MDAARLLGKRFVKAYPEKAASVLEAHSPDELISFFRREPILSGETLKYVSPHLSAAVFSSFSPADAASVLHGFPEDLTARVLRQIRNDHREQVLLLLDSVSATNLRRRLRYPEGSAVSYAEPNVLTLFENLTGREALKQIKLSTERVRHYLYVLNVDRHLVGVITVQEILAMPPGVVVETKMTRPVTCLAASNREYEILSHRGWRKFHALPVADSDNRFLGVIEYSTLQRMREESERNNDASPMSTFLAVSELYWNGLAGFLRGFDPGSYASPRLSQRSEVKPHVET